jgi:transposase
MAQPISDLLARRRPGYALEQVFCTDPEIFRADMETIFYRDWLFVAPACELPKSGSYITHQVGDYGVIIVRGADGEIRAVHNACRHRGSILCKAASPYLEVHDLSEAKVAHETRFLGRRLYAPCTKIPGKKGDRGHTGSDNRLFVDAVLWLARTASPWRDLPPEFGNWRTVHCRFRRWTHAGVWESLFKALSVDPDFEYVLVDATICKTHADAISQKGGLKLPVLTVPKAV